jgi:hypothetical protein
LAFQAYMDDSRSKNGTFILAGYIATAEHWAAFEKEWKELLPLCPRDKSTGQRCFKTQEMVGNKKRKTHVPTFFKVIQKNVLTSISCRMNLKDLKAAKRRIVFPNCDIDWNYIKNQYFFALRSFYDQFHIHKSNWSQFIPTDEPVDSIFDEDSDKSTQAMVISEWPRYIQNCSNETRGLYGACPRFEDDKVVIQLHAADLWAWWVRKCTDEGVILNELNQHVFYNIDLAFSEDQLVESLMSLAPPDAPEPIDTKYRGRI